MKNGVAIYGGFNGIETTLAERDYKANETILSGDIGANGAFKSNAPMTRAQMAKVIVLAFGLTPGGTSTFNDVPRTHWSYDYIAALENVGISLGDNGNFKPDEPVTRAQFVAFMYGAMNG
ncbi:S-layer homology domain-containing protein [Lysinibacillus sp. KU-BSD001]|uniref:S-layer homology domain-containing protein n=1 Tax=Lysinibacillus sp. KU-BSD001 TaxID=3141328 RepID=UPI0036F1370B